MRINKLAIILGVALLLAVPSIGSATLNYAVWLDGNASNGGNAIPGVLATLGNVTLVSTANLETPGFLNAFDAVVVSRFGASFGTSLSAAAAANVAAYVGAAGPSQGGVAIFTNDASDNLFGSSVGDPFDPNINQLFVNAATFAAQTHHGFIGEFNGAVMAMASNSAGFAAIDLLTGVASATHGASTPDGQFHYDVGPIGAGNPIDAGVTFPFTDTDTSIFRTDITGALAGNIVDVYDDNGLPAVMANSPVISGGGVPVPPSVLLLGSGLIGLAGVGFGRRKLLKKS